jgi:hypothetical protein
MSSQAVEKCGFTKTVMVSQLVLEFNVPSVNSLTYLQSFRITNEAFKSEAAAFERSQIVRLDSRQIGMLRYHLGTSYEDVFVPATGETDPHLSNTV